MLFASGAGVGAAIDVLGESLFCVRAAPGANFEHALKVAVLGGPPVSILIFLVRKRRALLAATLLLGAAMLGTAVALVALDKATYTCVHDFFGDSPTSDHAGYLYVLWGLPLAALLVQAGRILRATTTPGARRPSRRVGGRP
jgi:hypothetical protein